jgi:hypothetical protein
MLFAWAGSVSAAVIATAAIKLLFMNILLDGRLFERMLAGQIMRKQCVFVKSGNAAPRLLKHRRPAQYCNGSGHPSTRTARQ